MENDKNNRVEISDEVLRSIFSRLSQVESKVNIKSQPIGEYLTPKEVCEILKIGRSKFYSWVSDGYLNPIKPDPKGRKTYILRSEISAMFPKVLAFQ